ncbi:MAG: hypothetical protein ABI858_06305 [Pseudoxanthomonas sp.]
MNRLGWMIVRAYLPALGGLVLAVLAMGWTSLFGSIDALHVVVPFVKWLPPLFLLVALVAGLVATLRMWRWQTGKLPVCAGCGGPLGRVRHGAQGDVRKCLACGNYQAV